MFKNNSLSLPFIIIWLSACVFYVDCTDRSSEKGLLNFLFSPCKCRCGIPNREARILGGEYIRGYEFPWLALIQIRGIQTIPGTLINNRYVVTSASQLIGLTEYDIKVTLGQFDRCFPDVSSTNSSVEKIILHPDFSPGNRAHNIALIKLAGPIQLERRISPICLSVPGSKYVGQVATVVGWSESETTEGSVTASCRPRKLGLPVLGHDECLGSAADAQFVSADKGCIGVIGTPGVVCKTDSGGPVMYRSYGGVYELIGILTEKNECGGKPSTSLYTSINDHLSFITNNTKDACYCIKT